MWAPVQALTSRWRSKNQRRPAVRSAMILHRIERHRLRPQPFDPESCGFWYSYWARPWELLVDAWRELRSIWHRGCYGWDITDTWSLDHYLATILPALLRALAATTQGFPVSAYREIGHPEWLYGEDTAALREARAAHKEEDSATAAAWWHAYLERLASAFETWKGLADVDPFDMLYPPGVKEAEEERLLAGSVRDWLTRTTGPHFLDTVSAEDKRLADFFYEAQIEHARGEMRLLFDHFEELWD